MSRSSATQFQSVRSLGRVVIPPGVPAGFRVFYTTIDFDGRIDDRIREFVAPATLYSCHQVHGDEAMAVGRSPLAEDETQRPTANGERRTEPTCDALWSQGTDKELPPARETELNC